MLLLAILIFISLFYFGKRVYKLTQSLYEENNLKKRILVLEAENEVLNQRVNEYKKGIIIEVKARDDLGMIKKGEKVYIIKR